MRMGFGVETTEHTSLISLDIGFFLTREAAESALDNLAYYSPTPPTITELKLNAEYS